MSIGVIGFGFYGENHLHAWSSLRSEGANLIAVCDSDDFKGRLADDKLQAVAYSDAAAMLVQAYRDALLPNTQIDIHAHQNPSLAVANSITPIEMGAGRVNCYLEGAGAGAGNTPLEAFTGCTVFALKNAAEMPVRPLQKRFVRVDRETLGLGVAGVYSRFFLHAEKAAAEHGLKVRDTLIELGRRSMDGGQEDVIVDVTLDLVAERAGSSGDNPLGNEVRRN